MLTRIISAIVGAAIFAAAIVASIKIDSMILFVLITWVGTIGVFEALVNTGYVKSRLVAFCCLIYSLIVPFAYSEYIPVPHTVFVVLLGFILFAAGMCNHEKITPFDVSYAFAVTVAITFCFWAFAALFQSGKYGLFYMLLAVLMAWGCDTGAYFTGVFLGKHKLAPEISPKKTIEGAIGGVIFAMILMFVACFVFNKVTGVATNVTLLMIASPILAIAGMLGDLIASYVKRASGIKDYGKIMPGHGGVLDRFDSIMTVVPLIYLMVTYLPVLK